MPGAPAPEAHAASGDTMRHLLEQHFFLGTQTVRCLAGGSGFGTSFLLAYLGDVATVQDAIARLP